MSFDSVAPVDRIQRRRPGYSLEQPLYVDPAIFEIDLDHIYRRHWLLAGPTCRLRRSHGLDRTTICRREVEIIRANWKVVCENNQLGILSSRYQPGPYTPAESLPSADVNSLAIRFGTSSEMEDSPRPLDKFRHRLAVRQRDRSA